MTNEVKRRSFGISGQIKIITVRWFYLLKLLQGTRFKCNYINYISLPLSHPFMYIEFLSWCDTHAGRCRDAVPVSSPQG